MTANCTEEIETKTYSEDLVSFIVEMILVPAVGAVGKTGEQELLHLGPFFIDDLRLTWPSLFLKFYE